ncbi:uncharacterized protein LOC125774025 isoform X2 [Anopheles funestus]|uniref:uncharacterized protein LOC125774025 isoform X2 n=1 Tax=Anopheles funestus TaxID=62324 RepID=UPI0020C689C8|nr:uncharacterized protein LOC125774025 isoform X2 [Anopheles funestus]
MLITRSVSNGSSIVAHIWIDLVISYQKLFYADVLSCLWKKLFEVQRLNIFSTFPKKILILPLWMLITRSVSDGSSIVAHIWIDLVISYQKLFYVDVLSCLWKKLFEVQRLNIFSTFPKKILILPLWMLITRSVSNGSSIVAHIWIDLVISYQKLFYADVLSCLWKKLFEVQRLNIFSTFPKKFLILPLWMLITRSVSNGSSIVAHIWIDLVISYQKLFYADVLSCLWKKLFEVQRLNIFSTFPKKFLILPLWMLITWSVSNGSSIVAHIWIDLVISYQKLFYADVLSCLWKKLFEVQRLNIFSTFPKKFLILPLWMLITRSVSNGSSIVAHIWIDLVISYQKLFYADVLSCLWKKLFEVQRLNFFSTFPKKFLILPLWMLITRSVSNGSSIVAHIWIDLVISYQKLFYADVLSCLWKKLFEVQRLKIFSIFPKKILILPLWMLITRSVSNGSSIVAHIWIDLVISYQKLFYVDVLSCLWKKLFEVQRLNIFSTFPKKFLILPLWMLITRSVSNGSSIVAHIWIDLVISYQKLFYADVLSCLWKKLFEVQRLNIFSTFPKKFLILPLWMLITRSVSNGSSIVAHIWIDLVISYQKLFYADVLSCLWKKLFEVQRLNIFSTFPKKFLILPLWMLITRSVSNGSSIVAHIWKDLLISYQKLFYADVLSCLWKKLFEKVASNTLNGLYELPTFRLISRDSHFNFYF